jgi:hypothetical protein
MASGQGKRPGNTFFPENRFPVCILFLKNQGRQSVKTVPGRPAYSSGCINTYYRQKLLLFKGLLVISRLAAP